jgi:hypothetical protein
MRIFVTGARDLVGCKLVTVFTERHGAEVVVAFDLDPERLALGPPPPDALPGRGSGSGAIPADTGLDTATAATLDTELPELDTMLARLRREMDDADVPAASTSDSTPPEREPAGGEREEMDTALDAIGCSSDSGQWEKTA